MRALELTRGRGLQTFPAHRWRRNRPTALVSPPNVGILQPIVNFTRVRKLRAHARNMCCQKRCEQLTGNERQRACGGSIVRVAVKSLYTTAGPTILSEYM